MAQMPRPGTPGELPAFDATAGTQKPAPGHDPTASMGTTELSTLGKVTVGALLGGAAWYLWNYGWPFGKPKAKAKGK